MIAIDDTPRKILPPPSPDELDAGELARAPLDLWRERQAALEMLGHDCGGVDGLPGPRTFAAVKAFQTRKGLKPDGAWGPRTEAAVRKALGQVPAPPQPVEFVDMLPPHGPLLASQCVDLSAKSDPDHRHGRRNPAKLKRIVWHQTAFRWTEYRKLVAARKYSGHHLITAHGCIDTDGTLLVLHPFEAYLYTANNYNPSCLSFEVMGNFEGVLGEGNWYKPEKYGRHRPTVAQLTTARQLTAWLLAPTLGLCPTLDAWAQLTDGVSSIESVNPHRGATDDRDNDCGSETWYHVGEFSIAKLGLAEGSVMGRGRAVPESWRMRPITPPV